MKSGIWVITFALALAGCSKDESRQEEPPEAPELEESTEETEAGKEAASPEENEGAENEYASAINEQYGPESLSQRILDALEAAGKDPEKLTRDDVAGITEFHIMGRPATKELAKMAKIEEGDKVLDVGSGLGGPARTLAADFGAEVTALELSVPYHEAAQMLDEKLGAEGVEYVQGNALDMSMADDDSFDVVFMQHVQMNIEDKAKLMAELARVLKPDGRFAVFTIVKGQNEEPVTYPTPWADTEKLSFLSPEQEFKQFISDASFEEVVWQSKDDQANQFFAKVLEKLASRPEDAPPPLGLNVIIGEDSKTKLTNVAEALKDGRISVFMGVFELVP